MDSPGLYLRSRRESLGLKAQDIARQTRIGNEYIKAMEEERWNDLPAPVFAKGFIRSYCQALGEPPDEVLVLYDQLQEQERAPLLPLSRDRAPRAISSTLRLSLMLVLVLGAGLVGLSFLLHETRGPRPVAQPKPSQSMSSESTPPESTAPPSTTSTETPSQEVSGVTQVISTQPSAVEAPRSRLVGRTTELTWVKVTTDDGNSVQELLAPGTVREWTSAKRFVLTVGNAGGIKLEYNGRPLPPLGPSGAVIQKLVIPPEEHQADVTRP
jgi:cytoskeletal protein RodZ